MKRTRRQQLKGLPLPTRWAVVGAVAVGLTGAIVGLIVGLLAYAPTAPFAVFEVGLPAATAGGIIGLSAGLIVTAGSRLKLSRTPRPEHPQR